jgi:two-component system, NarL family, response regulator NreC
LREATARRGRVILADEHSNTLGAIRRLLETETETVLMVADEASLWDALENFNPDVVVADLSLPFSEGTNVARALKNKYPSVKVIILSLYDEKSVLDEVMATGVEGFVLKRRAVIDLIPAIREIVQGRKYFTQDMPVKQ